MSIKITISTSSKRIFNALENAILSQTVNSAYSSRTDFIEHLFDLSRVLDNGQTTISPDSAWMHRPELNQQVVIMSGKRPRFTQFYYLDPTSFTYP